MADNDQIGLSGSSDAMGALDDFIQAHTHTLGDIQVVAQAGDSAKGPLQPQSKEPVMVVFDKVGEAELRNYPVLGYQGLCEYGQLDENTCQQIAEALKCGGSALSISTLSAFGTDLADHFCRWLAEQTDLTSDIKSQLEMAVQEAIANAILHGNLEISASLRGNLETLEEFSHTVETRLKDERYCSRRVTVTAVQSGNGEIRVTVADEGRGYDPSGLAMTASHKPVAAQDSVGRGLHIIRQCASAVSFDPDGRRIEMVFEV